MLTLIVLVIIFIGLALFALLHVKGNNCSGECNQGRLPCNCNKSANNFQD